MSRIVAILALASSASAFTPSTRSARVTTLRATPVEEPLMTEEERAAAEEAVAPAPVYPTVNGWTANPSEFCWGLPGSTAPMGKFDPLGLAKDLDLTEVKRFREAEVTHGRVSMLAVVGFLVAESFHPLFGGEIAGPAIRHLDQVRAVAPAFFEVLSLTIAGAELWRSLYGWVPPTEIKKYFGGELKDEYYPGDIGFDPLNLKPADPKEFATMQTKELQNGRLAMLAAMGFIVQERINETPILENLF